MPIYEFRCNNCRRVLSVFVRSFSASVSPVCDACGGTDVTRLISKCTFQSVERQPSFSESEDSQGFEMHDPENMARWCKEMTGKVDEDVAPEFERVAKGLETGQFEVRPHQEEPVDVI
ncbi:MAG: zinc ribbon domain-containing protein [Chloroflexota bacterium]